MKKIHIDIDICLYPFEELSAADRQLVETAREATKRSYAPYSKFFVGAAAQLDNGEVISGSNQENAAFPSGLCAERTTLFYAKSRYPDAAVLTLAIVAKNERGEFLPEPIPPCGACLQVMSEVEARQDQPLRTLLYSTKGVYEIRKVGDFMPMIFEASSMD